MGGSAQWEVSGEASGKWVRARVLSSFTKGTRQLQRCRLALHPTQGAQKTQLRWGVAIIAQTPWHFVRMKLVLLGSGHPEKHVGYSRQDLEQAFGFSEEMVSCLVSTELLWKPVFSQAGEEAAGSS